MNTYRCNGYMYMYKYHVAWSDLLCTCTNVAVLTFPARLLTKHWYAPVADRPAFSMVILEPEDIHIPLWNHAHTGSEPLVEQLRVKVSPQVTLMEEGGGSVVSNGGADKGRMPNVHT